jgi:hypothetical protein
MVRFVFITYPHESNIEKIILNAPSLYIYIYIYMSELQLFGTIDAKN